MDKSEVALVIPAFNEAATIVQVIRSASVYGQVIVVNDASTDDTANLAKRAGAIVVNHRLNKGYDGALNSGFEKASNIGAKVIVSLDADGQHNPKLLKLFLEEVDNGGDVVFGVRNRLARIAETIFAFYANLRYGVRDPLCGMKAYRISVYDALGHFDSSSSIGTELCLYAAKNNFVLRQIDFVVGERQDNPRFGRLISANWRIIRAMFLDVFRK